MPKAEVKVYEQLKKKGTSVFLPLTQMHVQWKDRKKKLIRPLFLNYVFVKLISKDDKKALYETMGFVKLLSTNGMLDIVSNDEIETIQKLTQASPTIVTDKFEVGEDVIVTFGLFKGMSGKLVQIKGIKKLLVHLTCIKQSLAVEIDPACLKIVKSEFSK